MDANLTKEISAAILKLKGLSKAANRAVKGSLSKAAVPLLEEIQGRAPVSDEPHYRYSTPKASKKIKAPKGSGKIIATYMPGNLERSFETLRFRRAKNAVFVGPKFDKEGSTGTFSGQRTDGYYAAWQEFGAPNAGVPPRPFIGPSVAAVGSQVGRIAVDELKKAIEKYAQSVAV